MDHAVTPATRQVKQKRYVRAVGPRLRKLLWVVFALFALLAANSLYLVAIRAFGWATDRSYENFFYLCMFLLHLGLGLAIIGPTVAFGTIHAFNAHDRPKRTAVRIGYALFAVAIVLLVSGVVLTRIEGILDVRNPAVRSVAYWLHVLTPLAAIWLFILHRLAGPKIRWRYGAGWGAVAVVFAGVMIVLQAQDPRQWNVAGNPKGDQYFFPSLSRTVTGDFIPARTLMMDDYCQDCHADIHDKWSHSMHRFSSFNNPVYEFSVRETRQALFARDGSVQGARFCAGCHDPVPFFSGAFDDPRFDDPSYDLKSDPMAQAGITCTSCHAITHVNTPRGNSDFTIEEPLHYPFAYSDNGALQWINRQLVKAKPEFHKKTFLKPLHKTTEFCGTCHKVHLPEELNGYKWLRGQNHYDSFLLSGVSGGGAQSFYYPDQAQPNCNNCHMPLQPSSDFGAVARDDSGARTVHDHQFPSANTAIPHILGMPPWVNQAHEKFTQGTVRLDIFGLRDGGAIDDPLIAPIRPQVPTLEPGRSYLFETIIRTVKLGHHLTQGTADSNELWLDVTVRSGDRILGRSGAIDEYGTVDPWSHFVNAYVLDRDGRRIDRRNAQDIFTALYNNQIPPGGADAVHYSFTVPTDLDAPVTFEAALRYRKFDATLMRHVEGAQFDGNDLPVMTICEDRVVFPVAGVARASTDGDVHNEPSPIVEWQRWNDYGIGLLRKGERGELRQAAEAFARVEALGRPDGPLNLARVYIKEGLLQTDAPEALARAEAFEPKPPAWTLLWLTGLVNKRNARYDAAIGNFAAILEGGFEQAQGRNFDFSLDYRVHDELAQSLYLRALQERGPDRAASRRELLERAITSYRNALELDPENLTAHYGLKQIYKDLGDAEREAEHAALHAKYKPDDNATDRAIAVARRADPAANHAAEAVVIYDLQRAMALAERQAGSTHARLVPPPGVAAP